MPNLRVGPSRVPRVSAFGSGSNGFQPFAISGAGAGTRGGKRMSFATGGPEEKSNSLTMALTDKEIDERVSSFLMLSLISISNYRWAIYNLKISKAVEMEVARRLQEREQERAKEEEERRARQHEPSLSSEKAMPAADDPASQSLPSGVLTPLLQRHRDLDEELKARLRELENKL